MLNINYLQKSKIEMHNIQLENCKFVQKKTATNKIASFAVIRTTKHPFHLVDPSPWPFFAAMGTLFLMSGLVMYMHLFEGGFELMRFGFIVVLLTATLWWRDVIREATYEGHHTSYVRTGLRMGMALFIASEVMLFFAFFWAFFHSSLNPVVELGQVWPPKGIVTMNAFGIPLLNTFILVTSGAWLTKSQFEIVAGNREESIKGFIYTIILAVLFTLLQAYEYVHATFTISDGVFGSTFYMATGLHGSHVIVGTGFIIVCLIREIFHHFTRTHHLGFEFASWYWHFVDVVWIFLYFCIYYWGSGVSIDENAIIKHYENKIRY